MYAYEFMIFGKKVEIEILFGDNSIGKSLVEFVFFKLFILSPYVL